MFILMFGPDKRNSESELNFTGTFENGDSSSSPNSGWKIGFPTEIMSFVAEFSKEICSIASIYSELPKYLPI